MFTTQGPAKENYSASGGFPSVVILLHIQRDIHCRGRGRCRYPKIQNKVDFCIPKPFWKGRLAGDIANGCKGGRSVQAGGRRSRLDFNSRLAAAYATSSISIRSLITLVSHSPTPGAWCIRARNAALSPRSGGMENEPGLPRRTSTGDSQAASFSAWEITRSSISREVCFLGLGDFFAFILAIL